ncbi:hypothetical protein COB11_03835 [Candidatus Aerophobetes bacterium]|uniref:Uncharacterized protein n=1 Tax=Aerophobetes bacterium TaxID=2030807 RepID=A0A2A4YIH5_UNCAE|nr:MAG: hypothetical protein COB11_03835 [Candidatus Aerophobetes bacterium]
MVTPLQSNIPVYDPNGSIKDRFANYCDSYLSLSPTYASVEGYDFHRHEVVVLIKGHWDLTHVFKSAVKILSYASIVLPLIAYVFSNAYRSEHRYHVKTDDDNTPKPTRVDEAKTKCAAAKKAKTSTTSVEDDEIMEIIPEHIIKDTDTRKVAFKKADAAVEKSLEKLDGIDDVLTSHLDLIRKNYLEHCTISSVISRFIKKEKLPEDHKHFVYVRTDQDNIAQERYPVTAGRKKNEEFRKDTLDGHPKKGAMALSVHLTDHYNGVYVDFDKKLIVCYEPFGKADERNLPFKTIVSNLKKNYFAIGENVEVRYIQREHQKDGYNCGRYVINFFLEMLKTDDNEAAIKTLEDYDISKDEIRYRAIGWGKKYQQRHSDY